MDNQNWGKYTWILNIGHSKIYSTYLEGTKGRSFHIPWIEICQICKNVYLFSRFFVEILGTNVTRKRKVQVYRPKGGFRNPMINHQKAGDHFGAVVCM